jgi:IS5 family transposase
MKPQASPQANPQRHLFMTELINILNPNHALVRLSKKMDWDYFDNYFGQMFDQEKGRPAICTRLMVALHYLKFNYDLSDETVVAGWIENPYWQYFSGMKYFAHEAPIDPSSMSNWRKRFGQNGAEALLKQTIEVGLKVKAIKETELKRVNVDTTVQEKFIRYPTDIRSYDRVREHLVKMAMKVGIELRQNYNKVSKKLLFDQARYAHARQMQRAAACVRKSKTILGRVIRDIERKMTCENKALSELLLLAKRIFEQTRYSQNKVYSVHEPHVVCITKGKAHKKFEFGCKVGVAATSRGGWLVGAMAFPGNPYDGHTLKDMMEQVERVAKLPKQVFVDLGYRGHNGPATVEINVVPRKRGKIPKNLWRWMKRRAAVEPTIGHLKHEHRMTGNRLKGTLGDQVCATLAAAAMNLHKLLKFFEEYPLFFFFTFCLARIKSLADDCLAAIRMPNLATAH